MTSAVVCLLAWRSSGQATSSRLGDQDLFLHDAIAEDLIFFVSACWHPCTLKQISLEIKLWR